MTYNFTDDPSPTLNTVLEPTTGAVVLADGAIQGNLITDQFSGGDVSVSIVPPSGWSLDDVQWTTGGTGTFAVPPVGEEHNHGFTYTVSHNGSSQSSAGSFKIKKVRKPPTA
ncbi:hypothetical protein ENSA5_16450 [Enhygromyxa salina]|uniref:Uncharacterized protein n=1 Tax=Enhygromyxa salina TaxID=215803 RepID=A0A2S9YE35_9BACT|nr:hypothetical protein [Enhygromyxa salina]PRQ03380.1 hypothetical protein ENSA5_16450 [Enhygromyxa salina]